MLTIPICGLFFGSGRLPVAQPNRAGGPAQRENLVLAAFHALEDLERIVRQELQFIHSLKLVEDAESLADRLQGGAGAARGRFPATENEEFRFVETGDGGDGLGECGRRLVSIGESARGTVQGHEFEGHSLATVIHHLLQFGLGPRLTSQTLLPGAFLAR